MVNLPGVTLEQFRDVLLRMLDEQENLITENLALKAVLAGEVPAEHEPQVQVQGVVDAMRSGGFHSPEFDAFRRSQDGEKQIPHTARKRRERVRDDGRSAKKKKKQVPRLRSG